MGPGHNNPCSEHRHGSCRVNRVEKFSGNHACRTTKPAQAAPRVTQKWPETGISYNNHTPLFRFWMGFKKF